MPPRNPNEELIPEKNDYNDGDVGLDTDEGVETQYEYPLEIADSNEKDKDLKDIDENNDNEDEDDNDDDNDNDEQNADAKKMSSATSHHDDHHDEGSGSCGRAIVREVRRTIGTHYASEWKQWNQKTLAVSFFLFFACISPAITFGAVYSKATNNYIGAVEMITATAYFGILYAVIGGMPMMINGGTGPVLAFTAVLYKMSENMDIPFLSFNLWVGLWVALLLIAAAVMDMNRLMHHATRFTDEVFALLIASIFIIDALGSPFAPVGLYYYFVSTHKSHDEFEDDPDYSYMATALLSLVLCFGTTFCAFALKEVKNGPFFPNQSIRTTISDFGVVASIVGFSALGAFVFDSIEIESLNVPDTFAPTFECCDSDCRLNFPDDCPEMERAVGRRAWLVDLWDLNDKNWVPLMAALPALLAFILVFLDNGITWHLINHPCHKLQHGSSFNYDTVIVALGVILNSFFGMPWLVAATVRTMTHVHACAEKNRDGTFQSVQESRLTALLTHLYIGASIFALSALKVIPMPVLYGVFLYMGLASLGTNQFYQRVLMLCMQPSQYPQNAYTQHISHRRIHSFTAVQLFMFAMLYVVRAIKPIAIIFPIVIKACIPVRSFLLPRFFTTEELTLLDGDDDAIEQVLARKAAETKKTRLSTTASESKSTMRRTTSVATTAVMEDEK